MTIPYASEIYARLPRNEWFRLPVVVPKLFPDVETWEQKTVLIKAYRIVRKEAKYADIKKRKSTNGKIVQWCI